MRGGSGRAVRAGLAALGLLLAVAGCGGPATGSTALPTFAASTRTARCPPGPPADEGALPDDCERLLKVAELNALLGLPLDTVTVRSTLGIPEPSVGRTERVACRYSAKGAGPAQGRPLLLLNAAAYTSPDAALQQWRRNADIEDGVHRDLPLGKAGAVLVERGGEALLSVVYGPATLTLILPDQPLPGDRPRTEALVDLALRVLPAVAPPPTQATTAAGVGATSAAPAGSVPAPVTPTPTAPAAPAPRIAGA